MGNVTYYKINEDAVRRAKEMNSFYEYRPGSVRAMTILNNCDNMLCLGAGRDIYICTGNGVQPYCERVQSNP